jgi:hypothetical protein
MSDIYGTAKLQKKFSFHLDKEMLKSRCICPAVIIHALGNLAFFM